MVKPAFAIDERTYAYSDIDYIERKMYTNGNMDYIAHTGSGKTYEVYDNGPEHPELTRLFESNGVEIRETVVKPLIQP